jgi:hypothetical protein
MHRAGNHSPLLSKRQWFTDLANSRTVWTAILSATQSRSDSLKPVTKDRKIVIKMSDHERSKSLGTSHKKLKQCY